MKPEEITPESNEQNLELHKHFSFKEIIQHGIENGANVINGMPWSWKINGKTITHENDYCYIVEVICGNNKFNPDNVLVANKHGLIILKNSTYETHAPGGCPL